MVIAEGKTINILGIRGIPAAHGGFETFAEHLAPYLRGRGWNVNVYCQIEPDAEGNVKADYEDDWNGIRRIHLGTKHSGSVGSIVFDWRSIMDVTSRPGIDLVLGYNTAIFCFVQWARRRAFAMNMDGVEWKRAKWSFPVKAWFYLNEFVGANLATLPIADHPEIKTHLRRHGRDRAIMIPYGSPAFYNRTNGLNNFLGLREQEYFISIARIEPENSILEVVRAFSRQRRGVKLAVLGNFNNSNAYHNAVKKAASDEVVFPGAIYDAKQVVALRQNALAYVHGHQVGGTNPSLVEALGTATPIIAHDNHFNSWVAGEDQVYFDSEDKISAAFDLLINDESKRSAMSLASMHIHGARFTWPGILEQYDKALESLYLTRLGKDE